MATSTPSGSSGGRKARAINIAGHAYKGRTDQNHDVACSASDVAKEQQIVGNYIANAGIGCKP